MAAIDRFRGEWFFLSNFCVDGVRVELDGLQFPSVEHAYQAAKRKDPRYRQRIADAATPADAAELGRAGTTDPDWPERKDAVMLVLLRQKFAKEPLRSRLLATGDRRLIESNTWGDSYWGIDAATGEGANRLGLLLEHVRRELTQPAGFPAGLAGE